jgi:protein Mpv17
MLQSAAIWAVGDVIAQRLSPAATDDLTLEAAAAASSPRRIDYNRTAIAAAYGGLVFTPLANRWYLHILRVFPHSTLPSITKRVMSDQLVWSPIALAIYFTTMGVVHGGVQFDTYLGIRYKLQYVLPTTLATNWVFWVPVQYFNFFFVSPRHWLLTVNVAAIPWTAYLSWAEAKSS